MIGAQSEISGAAGVGGGDSDRAAVAYATGAGIEDVYQQAVALLNDFPSPTDQDIDAVMSGSLCRCMTYVRIRAAIKQAAGELRDEAQHG